MKIEKKFLVKLFTISFLYDIIFLVEYGVLCACRPPRLKRIKIYFQKGDTL
jgi:hypothetical protein